MTEPDHSPAAHYDRVTEAWGLLLGDDLHYGVFDNGDEDLPTATAALTGRMMAAAEFAPGQRMLDVGCGTGSPACDLSERFGVQVLGITNSPVGVEQATRRAADRGLSELVSFEIRDGMDNRLPDASFDRVWALESSHLMADRAALVAECARVLAPGGRFILCDIMRMREIPFLELRARTREFAVLRSAHGNARMEPPTVYRDLMESAGLVVDRVDDLTQVTLPTFDRWRANAAEHLDEVTAALTEEGLRDFLESADILESFWRDGTLGYALVAGSKP